MKEMVDYFLSLDNGEKTVFFYGGEPLLRWKDVKLCVQYVRTRYRKRKVNLQITTNGTIHLVDFIDFCKQNHVDVGISIDGPEHITNAARLSRVKGLNVFKEAFKLIHTCQEAGVKFAALCTITKESAPFLEEITDFFIKEKIGGLGFNIIAKRAGESVEEDLHFWDDLGKSMSSQYRKLLTKGILEPRGLRYLRGIAESRFTVAECDAGYRGQIIVSPKGLIGPCQAYLHDPLFWVPPSVGKDIRSHPLWLRFSEGLTVETEPCVKCPFVGTCGGGCRYNRNDFRQPNLNFCQYIRSFVYHTLASFEGKEVKNEAY